LAQGDFYQMFRITKQTATDESSKECRETGAKLGSQPGQKRHKRQEARHHKIAARFQDLHDDFEGAFATATPTPWLGHIIVARPQ
jgi:hypothetical protein